MNSAMDLRVPKNARISWIAEKGLASQEELTSLEWVSIHMNTEDKYTTFPELFPLFRSSDKNTVHV